MNSSNKLKNICIVTHKYPNKYDENVLVFVQQLAWQFAHLGVRCIIICPTPLSVVPKLNFFPYKDTENSHFNDNIIVLRPKYIGFGLKKRMGVNLAKITTHFFTKAVFRVIKQEKIKIDIIYSHFLNPAGFAVSKIGKILNVPSFMAYGESYTWGIDNIGGADIARKKLANLSGVIAVSKKNKNTLLSNNIVPDLKIRVFPNGYDPNRFYKMDKSLAREKMGFDQDEFIVGFVGSFDNRKGVLRLNDAAEQIEGIKFACAGKGALTPDSPKCIWKDPVNHENLVYFYNACDVFVLPTLNEGCCNAIIEAMACGLPIVSSDMAFNDELLDESNSIRINPECVDTIAEAILKLKQNDILRNSLSQGSIEKAKQLSIDKRAKNILNFMEEHL